MEIIRGKIHSAQKVVIYGPEGIGKSTFAAHFPNPLFIDTEGSTKSMDVARLKKPSSFSMLLEEIKYVKSTPGICKTLVIDTIDWAEQLCIEDVCASHNKKGIEDFGYGNGYVYVKEAVGKLLNLLEEVIEQDINVVLTAHAQMRKFEQPDELGAYDRYELKLGKKTSSQTSPLVKEWADAVLFANYKTFAVMADDKGKKFKAQGGMRTMYTEHHPCWDAKNRWGLKPEMPFDFAEIAAFIPGTESAPVYTNSVKQEMPEKNFMPEPEKTERNIQQKQNIAEDNGIPKAVRDLMSANNVTSEEIQEVVAQRGYFPRSMPVADYPEDFVTGWLIALWPQVFEKIKENRKDVIPF